MSTIVELTLELNDEINADYCRHHPNLD